MAARNHVDAVAGALLVVAGIWFVHGATAFDVGSLRRVGPGFFPLVLGVLLAGLGLAVIGVSRFRSGEAPQISPRPLAAILASMLAFAVLLPHVGMIPATVALVLIAAGARRNADMVSTLALSAVLAAIAYLIFGVALGVPTPALRWPS